MIKINNLSFAYRKNLIFNDFNLSLDAGKVYGLLGKNGAGKSTLLYLMTSLLAPRSGKILYRGNDVRRRLPETLSDIFIVPEEFSLPNIPLRRFMSINSPFYPRFSEEQLRQNLEHFDLEADLNVRLGSLSLGQKKKVFMSFALAANTSLLIMDEPTNGLDIPGKSQFKRFIASNMSDERTIIISTHQVQDIEKLIDHVVILDNSAVRLNASVETICKKLLFVIGASGNGEQMRENALYITPTLQGYNAVLPNADGQETNINLELLFNAALENPEKFDLLFNSKTASL
jgi:ABC-2 type transport system ATP-binding protein